MQHKKKIMGILLAFVSFLLLVLGFVVYTIMEAPLERISSLTEFSRSTSKSTPPELELLTVVSRQDLNSYLIFSQSSQNAEDFIQEALKNGDIEKVPSGYLIKKNFVLPHLLSNDCQRVFCFQSRLQFSKIPSLFWRGLIGVEDSRFLEHQGVDFKSIARAIIVDIKNMKLVQGGSTITQQLVKNLYFTNEKKIIRKLKELILAIYIETNFEKENILEAYFNEIYWGVKQGVYIKGIYAASLFYFGKKPSELSEFEVSVLISFLKGPHYYDPLKGGERLKGRANYVFDRLKNFNFISDKSLAWNENQWKLWITDLKRKEISKPYKAYYQIPQFKSDLFSEYEKYILLSNINKFLSKYKKEKKQDGVQLAVKAAFYDFKADKSIFYYSNVYRDNDIAINFEKHQVGSILKPIIYSFFMSEGYKLDDEVSVTPIVLNLKSGKWSPREAHAVEEKNITLREALQLSYNRPVIRTATEIGFEAIEKYLIDYIPTIKTPLAEFPAQLLGAVELSIKDVLEVYKKFILSECHKISPDKGLDNTILYSMSDPNVTTIKRQIGETLGQLRFFGKTGTSNNGNDNWFIGFDGRLLSIYWMGNEGEKSEQGLGLYGSTTAFQIFKNFLSLRGKQVNDIGCHFVE